MIGILPIAAGLLAVFSEDDGDGYEERIQRALLLGQGELFFEGMTPKEASKFMDKLHATWKDNLASPGYREAFAVLFDGLPMYTVFRATGHDPIGWLGNWCFYESRPCPSEEVYVEVAKHDVIADTYYLDKSEPVSLTAAEAVFLARKRGSTFVKMPFAIGSTKFKWFLVESHDPEPSGEEGTP